MREDLIETVTTMLFHQDDMTDIVIQLCKIATQEEEMKFEARLREAIELDLKPSKMAVSNFFTLDRSAKIEEYFQQQIKENEEESKVPQEIIPPPKELQSKPEPDDIEYGEVGGSHYKQKKETNADWEESKSNNQRKNLKKDSNNASL